MAADSDDPGNLYGLPLEQFVAARDALAKRLRAGGDRPAADAVKGLAKPSAAAWAVNQAVRSRPRVARALWAAGDELVATQERLLAGKADRDALRAATAAEREALAPLLDAARGLLTGGGAGVSETALARVEESLHAAALDPEVRGDVAAGRLTKELRHVGMGTFAAAAPAPSTARGSRSKRAVAGGTKAAGEGKRSGRGAGAAGAASAGAAGGATAAGEGKRTSGRATAPGEAKRAGTARRGRPAGDATGAAGQAKRGRSSAEREADERRAARAAAKQRVEAARGERAAARDALKAAREESREAGARAKAAVRAADAARREADRATAGADEAAEREQAARDRLDAAEAALRSAREDS